jgi:hypothetical protein
MSTSVVIIVLQACGFTTRNFKVILTSEVVFNSYEFHVNDYLFHGLTFRKIERLLRGARRKDHMSRGSELMLKGFTDLKLAAGIFS